LPSRWRATGEALLLVISGIFGLGFGTALSFRSECPQQFLLGKLSVEHIVARHLFHWRKSFRFVYLGMTLQALDKIFSELFRFKLPAISRKATTGFLSRSRSTNGSAPPES
jgi:hypothetical protein